jgi:PiT family inorganic phosphate transporter
LEATLLGFSPVVWIAGALALYMAWGIGANDVANAMGTSVGSGALTIRWAIPVAGVLEFCGAFLAGGHVTDTVRKGILDTTEFAANRDLLTYGMLASLTAAATLLLGATRIGLPVSTTHSIVGAIVGFGSVSLGADAVNWGKVTQIVASWVTSPVMGGGYPDARLAPADFAPSNHLNYRLVLYPRRGSIPPRGASELPSEPRG